MTAATKRSNQVSCTTMQRAIEEAVRRARREEGPGLDALRTAIRSGLLRGDDALAGALHCAALAKGSLDRRGVAGVREPELVLELLATAAAGLEETIASVTKAMGKERSSNAKQARRLS